MKNKLLSQYSLSAIALTSISTKAISQIIFTDPDPDLIYESGDMPLAIDIDNNGETDFYFSMYESTHFDYAFIARHDIFLVYPAIFNSILYYGNQNTFAAELQSNYEIGPENNWKAFNHLLLIDFANLYNSGQWNGIAVTGSWLDNVNFYFLGVKFKSDNKHFGWIRLKVNKIEKRITISDYAFNAQANASITTGDIGDNNSDLKAQFLNDIVYVFLPKYMLNDETTVELYETSGRRIFSDVFYNLQHIEIKAETLATGVYVVNAYNKDVARSAKVFIYKR